MLENEGGEETTDEDCETQADLNAAASEAQAALNLPVHPPEVGLRSPNEEVDEDDDQESPVLSGKEKASGAVPSLRSDAVHNGSGGGSSGVHLNNRGGGRPAETHSEEADDSDEGRNLLQKNVQTLAYSDAEDDGQEEKVAEEKIQKPGSHAGGRQVEPTLPYGDYEDQEQEEESDHEECKKEANEAKPPVPETLAYEEEQVESDKANDKESFMDDDQAEKMLHAKSVALAGASATANTHADAKSATARNTSATAANAATTAATAPTPPAQGAQGGALSPAKTAKVRELPAWASSLASAAQTATATAGQKQGKGKGASAAAAAAAAKAGGARGKGRQTAAAKEEESGSDAGAGEEVKPSGGRRRKQLIQDSSDEDTAPAKPAQPEPAKPAAPAKPAKPAEQGGKRDAESLGSTDDEEQGGGEHVPAPKTPAAAREKDGIYHPAHV